MFLISPGPQALGQKERLGAPPASTAHLVMAATEASHTAKEDGDPPTPYPSVPRTPTQNTYTVGRGLIWLPSKDPPPSC